MPQACSRNSAAFRPPAIALTLALAASASGLATTSSQATTPASSGAVSEKELLADFKESFDAPDPAMRATAVTTLGELSRQLPDKGAGKRVAQALAKGLEDRELEVGAAVIAQFCSGRDVDTVIGALDPYMRDLYKVIEKNVGNPDDGVRNLVERATYLFENGCIALANYHDDRVAALFVPLLAGLPADTKKRDLGSRLVGPLATAALEQGTEAAAEAAVNQTKTFGLPAQAAGARKLHDALAEFANRNEMTPPEWSDAYAEQWLAWLAANRNKLPKKLGRLTAPPENEPRRAQNVLPGKSG